MDASSTDLTPVPLTILTGFLGAGKTTLLNRLLNSDHGLRIAVMVNDFGSINIDSQLVVDVDADDTINLSNGCICCTIRGDLLDATRRLVHREIPPEYIIVETSGVSDPLEVALTYRYMPEIRIDSVLTVIDASEILDIPPENRVLAMNQVGMADLIILNKVDLVDEDTLAAVQQYIRKITPESRIIETTQGQVPLQLLLNIGHFDPAKFVEREPGEVHVHAVNVPPGHDHDHVDHGMVFSTWSWRSTEPVSVKALERAMKKLPQSIYRAKGIFYLAESPDQQAVLQVVGKRVHLTTDGTPWQETLPFSQFVVIGSGDGVDGESLQALMDGCLEKNAPSGVLERLTGAALNWLRG